MTQPQEPQPQGQWGPPPGQQWGPYGPPPKKKHTARNVILGVVGLIILIIIISSAAGGGNKKGGTTASSQGNTTKNSTGGVQKSVTDHSEDTSITKCAKDDTTGFPTASVKVTNASSKPSDYSVTVAFESPDGKTQYDTGLAAISNLAPGQSTTQDASSLKTDVPAGFTCKVVSADRLSAVG